MTAPLTTDPTLFVFFTFKQHSLTSRSIASLCRSPWSHMGAGIHRGGPGNIQRSVYWESLFKSGFTGPKPFGDLVDFSASTPGNRVLIINLPGIAPADVARLEGDMIAMDGKLGYGKVQLVLMALSERYGLPLPHTPNHAVCSEIVARLLYPHIDLRDGYHRSFDAVTPGSAYVRLLEHGATISTGAKFLQIITL